MKLSLLCLLLVGCSAAETYEPPAPAPSPRIPARPHVEPAPSVATTEDAGAPWTPPPNPTDDCGVFPGLQVLCWGSFPTDAGTSRDTACTNIPAHCSLKQDDAGANPDVWCCPGGES